ncbi:MAG: response regulator [Bacteroidetes bacterium]|nr:response regulator [Bacteroidota bacterium]
MLFKRNQGPKQVPPESSDSTRQEIATHLRLADKNIREGKYVEAREELESVRAVDPNNVYALALEERLQALEKGGTRTPVEVQPQGEVEQEEIPGKKETKPKEEKPQINEEAIRADIEKKLEGEYNKKFTDEIRKAEQRIAGALKKEREWQEAERASLIASLEKEKERFRKDLEKQYKENFEIEVEKMEAAFRQQLASERKKAEEETRSEMSSLYEKSMLELRESAVKEKQSLLEKQRKAIEDSKKQMEGEFEEKLSEEIARVKASTIAEQAKERDRSIEEVRARLQKEFDEKWQADKKNIEAEINFQQDKLENLYKERYKKLELESQAGLKKRLDEINQNERNELGKKQSEMRKQLEAEYDTKLEAELRAAREKTERRMKKEIVESQTKLEMERKRVVEEEQRKLNETRAVLKAEMEREFEARLDEATSEVEYGLEKRLKLLGVKLPDTLEQKLEIYRGRLRKAWASPPITEDTAVELMQLREILELTFEDHLECESEIRLQAYTTEVEKEIKNGRIRSDEEGALEELKSKYQITGKESSKLGPFIFAAFQRAVLKGVILLVDDDHELLDTVTKVLEGYGYGVLTGNSPTAALKVLETTNVDIIISDVLFSETEGDGFSFYEQVQKIPHLKKVPFILISGMHESFFVRAGVQLGVDDYLTKPVDPDLLAAVVEGKLKKYRSIRGEE